MKKFVFFLFFLLAAGGAGFFFGWAQFSVPPGSFGVMRSKTHGLEANVIKNGELNWFWYKLIPTNAKITVFNINTVKYPIKSSGSLSSGELYMSLAGIQADFSWDINGELSFNINPEHLPAFTDRENINNDADLRTAEKELAERISSRALQRIISYMENADEAKIESMLIGASIPELEEDIYRVFPEIENLNCLIHVNRYPDFVLYRSIKALYEEYQARQRSILGPNIARGAESRIESRIRMDELAQYGDLLTRYPILLQFLALEKGLVPRLD